MAKPPRKLKTSAGGSSAGFYFQLLRAAEVFLDSHPPERVVVEGVDDIEHFAVGIRTLEQLKHSLSPENSELSVGDLLKTLKNRIIQTKQGEIAESDRLIIFTNRSLISTFESEMFEAVRMDDLPAFERLIGEKSLDDSYKDYCKIIGDNINIAWSLLARSEIGRPTIATQSVLTRLVLLLRLPPEHINKGPEIIDTLAGWIGNLCLSSWYKKEKAIIKRENFNIKLHRILIQLEQSKIILRRPSELQFDSSQIDPEKTSIFVKQLHSISFDEDSVNQEILNCLRARIERHRLNLDGYLLQSDWDDFDESLIERWQNVSRRLKNSVHITEEERGAKIFEDTVEGYLAELAGRKTNFYYLTRGSYHELANDPHTVRWNLKFKASP